ncbi:hypothetical protein ACC687_38820, partial [Rhizobium ruizarguesonis]
GVGQVFFSPNTTWERILLNPTGERIKLPQISSFCRYKPSSIQLADPDDRDAPHQTYYFTWRPGSIAIDQTG